MRKFIFVAIFLSACLSAQGRIITVDDDEPADFNNIQAAINDADDGDEVVIQQGTYTGDGNRDIDFLGKTITVRSTDPDDWAIVESTIVDCNATSVEHHRGFHFHNNEGPLSKLEGITIKNAYVEGYYSGGGILVQQSNPTINKCNIVSNYAEEGGGIFLLESNSTISDCVISGNQAGNGGGINVSDSYNPVFTNCMLSDNLATGIGGGIRTQASSIQMSNCIVANNTGISGGGIISDSSSDFEYLVEYCQFIQNEATGEEEGGGGGGMAIRDSVFDMKIRNCLFLGNTTFFHGGGIFVNNCGELKPKIVNCTFKGNKAEISGGAVVGYGGSGTDPKVYNCVIWENEPNSDCGITTVWNGAKCGLPTVTAKFSVLQSDWKGQSGLNVENCFVADPCFADPDANDLHLQSEYGRWDPNSESWVIDSNTSLAIDAGDPNSDFCNEPAPHGNRTNLGAYGNTAEASMSATGCFPASHHDYSEWVAVGMPACWCHLRQCHGDTDGQKEGSAKLGYWYVGDNDLNIMVPAWKVKDPPNGPGLTGNYICADFAHNKEGSAKLGYWRVGDTDLNKMIPYWKSKEMPYGPGVPDDCLDMP